MTCQGCGATMAELRMDPRLFRSPMLYFVARRHAHEPRLAPPNVAVCDRCSRAEILRDVEDVEPEPRSLVAGLLLRHLGG